MEIVQAVRFYNGGKHKRELMQYTALEYNIKVENGVRYFPLEAPTKGFFDVPREIRTEEGAAQLLGLPTEIMEKYGPVGFVMIDKNATDERCAKEPFLANSDETARGKGDQLWRDYCFKKVKEFEDNNEKRKAGQYGQVLSPARPDGFVLHAYRELGILPPGAEEEKKAKEGQSTIEELKESNALMQRQLTALMERMPPAQAQPEAAPAEAPTGKKGR